MSSPTDTQFYRRHKKPDNSLTDRHVSTLCFYGNIKRIFFFGHNILTESVFATQQSSYAETQFDEMCGSQQTAALELRHPRCV